MDKKTKLYYIPLEIGAWTADTNCVSMEMQGCLLNLIFKLWDSPTKGVLSFSFSQLAFLFKKTPQEAQKIIEEIQQNNLLNVEFLGENLVKLESRKMLRDAANSLIKSNNGKQGGRGKSKLKANKKQKESKTKANSNYNYNSLSDSNNESVLKEKGGMGEKTKFNPIDHIPENWNGDLFLVEWDDFMKMRKKKGWSCADRVLIQRISQLKEHSGGNWETAEKIMQKSTERTYAEFFPLDSKQSEKPTSSNTKKTYNELREYKEDQA